MSSQLKIFPIIECMQTVYPNTSHAIIVKTCYLIKKRGQRQGDPYVDILGLLTLGGHITSQTLGV